MSALAERIKDMLGNGLSNGVVATAVGVDPSYITQLMSDPQFSEEVVNRRIQTMESSTLRDRSWDSIEDKLLNSLAEKVEQNMIFKPNDILNALRVVNSAKRRGTEQQQITTARPVVTLNLPTVIVKSYTKTSRGEVVEIETEDGNKQTLVTMPANQLMKQLAETASERKGDPLREYEKIRRYLPSGDQE